MDQDLIIQQIGVESQVLEHVIRALEVTILWKVEGDDCSRKLSSVRFVTESYQRHLERLFALEELDGYMDIVSQSKPELTKEVADRKQEHELFRGAIRKLVVHLEQTSSTDVAIFNAVCDELQIVIQRVLEHNRREDQLLVESIQRDTGGEG